MHGTSCYHVAVRDVTEMTRLWTEDETIALREYIDSHLGHCAGLNGSYWDGLSLALENVRRNGDPVLKKHQVANKIVQFRKREVTCTYILQYGTNDNKTKKFNACKEEHESYIHTTGPACAVDTPLQSSGTIIGQPSKNQIGAQKTVSIDNSHTTSSVLLASFRLERKLKAKSDLHTPVRSSVVGTSNPCTSSGTRSGSRTGLKHTQSDDSRLASANSRRKKRRTKQRQALHERSIQGESASKQQPFKTSSHERGNDTRQFSRSPSEQLQSDKAEVFELSKRLPDSDTLSFIDIGNIPWQDQMSHAWHGHLAYQDLIHITQKEAIDHRETLCTIEDIANRIGEASDAMQKMFSTILDVSKLAPSGAQILSVLTGCKTQSEAADTLMIAQSLALLSTRANLFHALIGATVHQWIFEDFQSVIPQKHHHDLSRTVFDNFIQRECPQLWASYHDLYRHQFLSTYNEERIVNEAKKMASDVYVLLSAACSMTGDLCAPPRSSRPGYSTMFNIQAQHYQNFKSNMIEAYRLALDVRVSFAKCSDLTYEFHFPKMRDKFDPTCMESRKSAGDDDAIGGENQHIAVCFLPSIWSRARSETDYGKPSTLVTKAIVLL